MAIVMSTYRVYLHSQPSPAWTFYQGVVTVKAADEDMAVGEAKDKLRRGSFPERSRSSWVVDRVERAG